MQKYVNINIPWHPHPPWFCQPKYPCPGRPSGWRAWRVCPAAPPWDQKTKFSKISGVVHMYYTKKLYGVLFFFSECAPWGSCHGISPPPGRRARRGGERAWDWPWRWSPPVYLHIWTYIYIIYIYIFIHIHMCVYIYKYIWIYTYIRKYEYTYNTWANSLKSLAASGCRLALR